MNRAQIIEAIRQKQSFLCVGLDTDINKIPGHLKSEPDPVFAFNKAIIDATHDLCIAYKPNTAFYEAQGISGWSSLKKTADYLPTGVFKIADAKRGDIGNTASMYATAFLEQMNFDAITVSPYMGKDSVTPFLEIPDKWVILLAATSNPGSLDFQHIYTETGLFYEVVVKTSMEWATSDRMMYVVGATRADVLSRLRATTPDHFLLVPGIGAQGGSLKEVCQHGMNSDCGLIVNVSRSILYASPGKDFAEAARDAALKIQQEMKTYLKDIDF